MPDMYEEHDVTDMPIPLPTSQQDEHWTDMLIRTIRGLVREEVELALQKREQVQRSQQGWPHFEHKARGH